ncbi:MAG: YitT family protein [bacterium]|nr:YitT family protein [bacterium]
MKKKLINLLLILFGNACIAFAVNTLILEHGIICGGVSGIGSAVEHYFGIPVSLVVGILNIALFFLGLKAFGKEFAMSIIISTFAFPAFLEFFDRSPFHGYLNDSLLAMAIGGCLVGLGIGVVIKANASTGGVDILAQYIHKKFEIPVYIVLNVIDVLILAFQITYSDTTNVIYGIIMTFVSSTMLKKTLSSGRSLIQLTIISDSYEEIKKMILHEMDAGVTMILSEKGYTEKSSKLITTVIQYQKLPKMKENIREIDPMAFIIVAKIEEVGGKGFTMERQ